MTDVGGPRWLWSVTSLGRWFQLLKKSSWASHGEQEGKLWSHMASASIPASRFLSCLLLLTDCSRRRKKHFLPQGAFGQWFITLIDKQGQIPYESGRCSTLFRSKPVPLRGQYTTLLWGFLFRWTSVLCSLVPLSGQILLLLECKVLHRLTYWKLGSQLVTLILEGSSNFRSYGCLSALFLFSSSCLPWGEQHHLPYPCYHDVLSAPVQGTWTESSESMRQLHPCFLTLFCQVFGPS